MIHTVTGNILDSHCQALVNTVNLVGVMGKGIALQFKTRFPENFRAYQEACRNRTIGIGRLLLTEHVTLTSRQYIINFPTKTHWRLPSEYDYIASGLTDLLRMVDQYHIRSIAIPPLGSGNGGLDWSRVKPMIERAFEGRDIEVHLYEPSASIAQQMKSERVRLTPARALLLYMLFDLTRQGEHVSEFACEKICYFLQRLGGADLFRLTYNAYYYGPYSGKVRHVLYALNGSYIMGYSGKDKRPFDILGLVSDTFAEIKAYVEQSPRLVDLSMAAQHLLKGCYSDFTLELLSSVDFIACELHSDNIDAIHQRLVNWSQRKSQLFGNRDLVQFALDRLQASHLAFGNS